MATDTQPISETDEPQPGDNPDGMDRGATSDTSGYTVALPKEVPEIADGFKGCQVGDMYKVTADDDDQIVLEKVNESGASDANNQTQAEERMGTRETGGGDGRPEDKGSDNPAIAVMIAKKQKR
jgi:hypothetical protein